MHFQRAEPALKMSGSKMAEAFFASWFAQCDPSTETLFVAHVDEELRCVHVSRHQGDARSADFPLKQIIADAIHIRSAGLILAHNHPSGNAQPSEADCQATKRLAAVAEAIDCSVIDHLIFGSASCTSFRKMGLI